MVVLGTQSSLSFIATMNKKATSQRKQAMRLCIHEKRNFALCESIRLPLKIAIKSTYYLHPEY